MVCSVWCTTMEPVTDALPTARSTSDKKLAGVCAALARHWQVDPLLVRVALVTLSVSGGIGLLFYACAWFWWPAENQRVAGVDRIMPGLRESPRSLHWLCGLVIVAPLLVAASMLFPFGPATAIVLVGTWWVCEGRHRHAARRRRRLDASHRRALTHMDMVRQAPQPTQAPVWQLEHPPAAQPAPHPSVHEPVGRHLGAPAGPPLGRHWATGYPEPTGLASDWAPRSPAPQASTTQQPAGQPQPLTQPRPTQSGPAQEPASAGPQAPGRTHPAPGPGRPRRKGRRRKVLVSVGLVLILGGAAMAYLYHYNVTRWVTYGIPLVLTAAGIAGLVASVDCRRPKKSRRGSGSSTSSTPRSPSSASKETP